MDDALFTEIQVGDCRIAVARQDNYQDKTLVFLHGNSLSSQIWEKQFSGSLYEHYNLLAFDLPGHGNSSRAQNPEQVYCIGGYRNVLLQVVRHYGLESFILVGHSLGGHVVLESLPYLQGCEAAVVIGTPPLSKPLDMQALYMSNPYQGYLFAPEAPPKELNGLMKALVRKTHPEMPAFLKENYQQTDPQARVFLGKSAAEGLYDDEVEIMAHTSVPVSMVLGEEDQLVSLRYLLEIPLRSGLHSVVTIPKAGHMAPYENPVYFNKVLMRLLSPAPTL